MSGPPVADYKPFPAFEDWCTDTQTPGESWSEYLQAFKSASSALGPEALSDVVDVALRSAALETGAIEGLYTTTRGVTMTVAVQAATWEAELEGLGADVRGHFEAHLAAYEMVLDAATEARPITEAWLRSLHQRICENQRTYRIRTEVGYQDVPLPRGAYKTSPNQVLLPDGGMHAYAPVAETGPEMARLVHELRGDRLARAHPVVQAAYAHHALTVVHPFADGNGRTARALASVYLYRAAGIPFVVFADQREQYFDSLSAADRGVRQPFVTFVEDRAIDTLAVLTDRIRDTESGLASQAERVRRLLAAHGGLSHAEVQSVGRRLFDAINSRLASVVDELRSEGGLPTDIQTGYEVRGDHVGSNFGGRPYRPLQTSGLTTMTLSLSTPVQVHGQTSPNVGIAQDPTARFAFIVIDANRPDREQLLLRLQDLHPNITAYAESRIGAFARRSVAAALADVERALEQRLKSEGLA